VASPGPLAGAPVPRWPVPAAGGGRDGGERCQHPGRGARPARGYV